MEMSRSKEGGRIPRIVPGLNGISFDGTHTAFPEDLEKRISVGKGVTKDSEISIFQAENYFNSQEEEKTDANRVSTTQSSKSRQNHNSNTNALSSIHDFCDSDNRIPSPAFSIGAVNPLIRPDWATPMASSETRSNSQSPILSTAVHKMASRNRKREFMKWLFGCACPYSNKSSRNPYSNKSSRSPYSMLISLMDSPVSSVNYSNAIEKQRTQCSVDDASEVSGMRNCVDGRPGIKTLINPVTAAVDYNILRSCLFEDKELQTELHRNRSSFIVYERDSHQGESGEGHRRRRINCSSLVKEDGFSFPIHPEKFATTPRLSIEILSSPIPGTPDSDKTRNPNSDIANPHQRQPSDLDRRLLLSSPEKGRRSLSFNSKSESHYFTEADGNADVDKDNYSDSSSDLFEIESLTTQGTASCALRRRDSPYANSSIQSGYPCITSELGFHNSLHFYGMGEALTPSPPQSLSYEPSEASLDWSVTTGDTLDMKASLGEFSSAYEDTKKPISLQGPDLSGLRDSSIMGSSKRRSSTKSFRYKH